MKKVLKWLGIGAGAVAALIVAASVVIMLIVDEKMIAEQMTNALNRHVVIEDISVGILSAVSGIEVNGVQISNFKTPKQLEALKDNPVPKNDLFVGMKSFKFKIQFMPLLSGNFVLNELMLYEPVINVIKYKDGRFNFDDLAAPSPAEAPEEQEEAPAAAEEPSGPLTADTIPISIEIGKIGMEKAQLTYEDRALGQTFQVYNLTTLIHSIDIDPADLDKHNSVKLKVEMGVKTVGAVKTGSVQSFDIGFDIEGDIIPFDKKTRILEPEIALKAGLPYGTMTGLQILENMKSVDSLSSYCGKLDFLKKELEWQNAYVDVWYKAGIVKMQNGRIPTEDYELTYAGQSNINKMTVDLEMDMLLADTHKTTIRSGIMGNVKKAISAAGQYGKYANAEKVTDTAMARLVNEDGKVYLKYQVTGPMNKPNAKLVAPKLPTIKELLKDAMGDVKDAAIDKGKEAAQKVVDEEKDKAVEKGKEETKKQTDKLKKKIKL